jgi:hypothetical protein
MSHSTPEQSAPGSVAARLLTQPGDDDTSSKLAGRAVAVLAKLTDHMAQLVGDAGARAVLDRSVTIASTWFAWLGHGTDTSCGSPWPAMQRAMETRSPAAIRDGFDRLLATYVALLGRLIGEGLVMHVLHQLWPDVYPDIAKETA